MAITLYCFEVRWCLQFSHLKGKNVIVRYSFWMDSFPTSPSQWRRILHRRFSLSKLSSPTSHPCLYSHHPLKIGLEISPSLSLEPLVLTLQGCTLIWMSASPSSSHLLCFRPHSFPAVSYLPSLPATAWIPGTAFLEAEDMTSVLWGCSGSAPFLGQPASHPSHAYSVQSPPLR